jgi:hypothetical protein
VNNRVSKPETGTRWTVAAATLAGGTITLTMDRYTLLGFLDTGGALENLPPLPNAVPAEEEEKCGTQSLSKSCSGSELL